MESSRPGSTLPPDSTATVVPDAAGATWPPSSAATPTAPAPSTTSLQRSISQNIASAGSSSSTTTSPSSHSPRSGEREVARALDRDAVGDRQRRGRRHRLAALERGGIGRAGRDLHADDLDLGPRGLDGDGDPRGQPAAADGHDDAREVGHVLEQLEPERALAGDDVRVVVGVHEGGALRRPRARARAPMHSSSDSPPTCTSRRARAPPRPWRSARRAGTKTSQRTPRAAAAAASAWAWLPAEAATTPRAQPPRRAPRAWPTRRAP